MEDQRKAGPTSGSIEKAVIELLGARPTKARFVVEVAAAMQRLGVSADDLELALDDLEGRGTVIVRQQACPDPHLAGIDLRVVGLVDAAGQDPDGKVLADIESIWQRWLGEYLANHRCS